MNQIEAISKVYLNVLYIPFIWIMQYLSLDSEAIFIFAVLLAIDLVTGWAKTVSLGEKPRSRRLAKGILAKSILLFAPIVLALGSKAVHIDTTAIVFVVVDAFILAEVYSIIGNMYTIRTGKHAEEYDVMSKVLKMIRKTLDNLLEDGR